MPNDEDLDGFAVKSYRYLRLAIVVVVLALMASVVIEVVKADCWQESISAYYYTPVHAVFVGALVALGVCMIAIKGGTDVEDMLLNVAGVLAPIVAFVPTSQPSDGCEANAFVGGDPQALIDNNVLALAIGGFLAIVVGYLVAAFFGKASIKNVDASSIVGLLLGAALLAAGLIWYFGFRESFLDRAHGWAAGVMFVLIGMVIVINARSSRRVHREDNARRYYWIAYAALAAIMVLSALGVVIAKWVHSEWRHQILVLEILELTPFAVFWSLQTQEFWKGGVPTGNERASRTASLTTGGDPLHH
ncbi:MAG: hypothetical protein ACR2HQ_09755 [Ilumatobacteraceae bacterium]